jgi:hypothetical protein
MSVYLEKHRNLAGTNLTPKHDTVLELLHSQGTCTSNIYRRPLHFSKILKDFHWRKIDACGTGHHYGKEMPSNFRQSICDLEDKTLHQGHKEINGWH